jgi:GDP-L-fucose synthase
MLFDLTDKLVWVAGQHGMVGGAMMRRLQREPCALLRDPGRAAVDLRRRSEVEDWMASGLAPSSRLKELRFYK